MKHTDNFKKANSLYIPTAFKEVVSEDTPIKFFPSNDLRRLNRIFNHLRRGGVAVLAAMPEAEGLGLREQGTLSGGGANSEAVSAVGIGVGCRRQR